jgi:hypothetical protein
MNIEEEGEEDEGDNTEGRLTWFSLNYVYKNLDDIGMK